MTYHGPTKSLTFNQRALDLLGVRADLEEQMLNQWGTDEQLEKDWETCEATKDLILNFAALALFPSFGLYVKGVSGWQKVESSPSMDYRLLLTKYLRHVGECEGITFLGRRRPDHIVEEEWEELQRLDKGKYLE